MNVDSIYAPPKANLVQDDGRLSGTILVRELRKQSTGKLLLLTIVTLGIYSAHYIERQTVIINKYINDGNHIAKGLVSTILLLAYGSVLFIVPSFFFEETHIINVVGDVLEFVWSILVIVWSFKARNRMNHLLSTVKGEKAWFHGFWTFFFQYLYVNYKINQLNEN
ncbi:MAG: DUF4234 domain-containing protein [Desulfobacterales bacterium]|nr:DUF4234 domain-containing protein [Desulfobacterales bacterium]